MMNKIVPATEAETALISLMTWAETNFDKAVADGVSALVRPGLQALREKTLQACHAQAYAHELERQRDYASMQLMHAETTGRMTGQREIIQDISKTLRVAPADAINLLKTLTGETEHLIGDFQIGQAADLARDITADLHHEALPLADTDTLPALPDDFDTDEDDL